MTGGLYMRLTLADVLTLAGDSDELLDAIAEVMAPRPATASDVVEYLQIPTGSVFNLAPTGAIEYFKAKGLVPTFSYADMLDEAHDEAFTIAKMMDVDLLGQVRASLSDAMANGIPFRQWSDEIIPMLQKSGWWGTKNVIDPVTGQPVLARLGTPGRLKTIFRTNMQASYAAGQWEQIDATKQVAPYLLYDAVDDYRTREEHAAWDGTVLKVDDPWWTDHYPPNGYNCRCSVIQLTEDEVKALNLEPDPPGGPDYGTVDWKNPRTGMLEAIPWGLDPGFAHHPGKHYLKTIKKRLDEKVAALPPAAAAQASEGVAVSGAAAQSAKEAAKAELTAKVAAAQKELAKAAGKAHLKHAIERAHAQAAAVAKAAEEAKKAIAAAKAAEAEAAAKAKLDAIVKAGGANTYEKAALKKLLSDNAWSALPASERLAQFEQLASSLKAKQLVDTKLAKYKKAILEGKTPPPNVAKVLDELDEATKTAFLKKIDDELAAKAAAEEAAQKAALEKEWDDLKASILSDEQILYAVNDKAGLENILSGLDSVPVEQRLAGMKIYVKQLRENAEKAVLAKIDAVEADLGSFPFADIPGGQFSILGKQLNAIYDAVISSKKDWSAYTFAQKKTLAEAYEDAASKIKAKIAAEQADNLAQVEINKELGTLTNELDDLADANVPGAAELGAKVEAEISKSWATLDLDGKNFLVSSIKTDLEALKAKAAAQPPPAPTVSKQWQNVDAAANAMFYKMQKAGYTAGADSLAVQMAHPKWNSGAWTLKKKKEFIAKWQESLDLWKAKQALAAEPPDLSIDAGTSQPGVNSLLATKPPDPARLTQIGPQKGSNPGGLFQDATTGEKFYVKWFDTPERARNELLAGKLYELVGAETPELAVFKWPDGRTALSSKWVDGLKGKLPPGTIANAEGAYDFFAADAWLANWDVVGAEFDNLVLRGTRAFRVDVGGALRFRAQGTPKGAAFGDEVLEIDTLRTGQRNWQAVEVFKDIPDDTLLAGVRRVLKPSDEQIRALVEEFGPSSKAERDALLKTLLARREYLRKRFPNAVPQATRTIRAAPPAPRQGRIEIDAETQRGIETARMNGRAVKTDGGDIEDHHVLVSVYTGRGGTPVTRGALKLTDPARERLYKALHPEVKSAKQAQANVVTVNHQAVNDGFRQWVIGVNSRTGKGAPLEAKDIDRAVAVQKALTEARLTLGPSLNGVLTVEAEAERQAMLRIIAERYKLVSEFLGKAKAGTVYDSIIPKQDFDALPSKTLAKVPPPADGKPAAGWQWQEVDKLPVDIMDHSKGRAVWKGTTDPHQEASNWGRVWVGEGPNGERIIFAAPSSSQRGVQGLVWIDVPGASAAASKRVFDTLEDVFRLDISAPTPAQVSEQYLNAFARLRLFKSDAKTAEYNALGKDLEPEARVRLKLEYLKKETGVDIEKSDGWRDRYGIEQAFGNGRPYQVRPDTDSPQWRDLEENVLLFNNPNHLELDSGSGVGDKLVKYLETSGSLLAQNERLRRGIVKGASQIEDRNVGGSAYLFTRIAPLRGQYNVDSYGTGFYFHPRHLRRIDAITYPGDRFGETTDHMMKRSRKETAEAIRVAGNEYKNETIFKESLSFFDGLIAVVVEDHEVGMTIHALRKLGYQTWPDGRKLEEVVVGRSAWVKRRTRLKAKAEKIPNV